MFHDTFGFVKRMPVGKLKQHFSEVIDEVKAGEEVIITYGRKRTHVAVIVPYSAYEAKHGVKLGLLKDKNLFIADDFTMTEGELFGS